MNSRYLPLSVWLHWTMLFLIIGVYACIEFRVIFERGTDTRELIKTWHYALGMSVLLLVIIRVTARILSPKIQRKSYGKFQRLVSSAMFLGLYGLMFLMPILGYLLVSAEGNTIFIFSMELPLLNIQDKELAHQIEEIHETIGKIGYGLIAVHALAGLYHHFVLRDKTMQSMLDFRGKI